MAEDVLVLGTDGFSIRLGRRYPCFRPGTPKDVL